MLCIRYCYAGGNAMHEVLLCMRSSGCCYALGQATRYRGMQVLSRLCISGDYSFMQGNILPYLPYGPSYATRDIPLVEIGRNSVSYTASGGG